MAQHSRVRDEPVQRIALGCGGRARARRPAAARYPPPAPAAPAVCARTCDYRLALDPLLPSPVSMQTGSVPALKQEMQVAQGKLDAEAGARISQRLLDADDDDEQDDDDGFEEATDDNI